MIQFNNYYLKKKIRNDTFHRKRIESLELLKLSVILQRKNPYLFRAKNILDAHDFVKNILDAFLISIIL